MTALASLLAPIEGFFEKVIIQHPDDSVRSSALKVRLIRTNGSI